MPYDIIELGSDVPALKDLTGQRFNRWTVLHKGTSKGEGRKRVHWVCRCDCGNVVEVQSSNLVGGRTQSCGCYHLEAISSHGLSKDPIYQLWAGMKQRCENPKAEGFSIYGARGIKVCERWQNFATFYADVTPRPSPQHTLDRVDNNKHYEPDNVRWATPQEQANNRSTNRLLTYQGKTQSVADWARDVGISKTGLLYRLNAGLPIAEVLEQRNRKFKQA